MVPEGASYRGAALWVASEAKMVKPKTPRAKHLPRSKDAEALDKAHDALLDAAKEYESNTFADYGSPTAIETLCRTAETWARAQRKALGVAK
jgi:hypothetical protein